MTTEPEGHLERAEVIRENIRDMGTRLRTTEYLLGGILNAVIDIAKTLRRMEANK